MITGLHHVTLAVVDLEEGIHSCSELPRSRAGEAVGGQRRFVRTFRAGEHDPLGDVREGPPSTDRIRQASILDLDVRDSDATDRCRRP